VDIRQCGIVWCGNAHCMTQRHLCSCAHVFVCGHVSCAGVAVEGGMHGCPTEHSPTTGRPQATTQPTAAVLTRLSKTTHGLTGPRQLRLCFIIFQWHGTPMLALLLRVLPTCCAVEQRRSRHVTTTWHVNFLSETNGRASWLLSEALRLC